MADSPPEAALWQRVRSGDSDAFELAVTPHRDALLRASRTAIDALRASGEIREDDLHPEELVGETLVRAFDGRDRFDARKLGLRAWLLGLQQRALRRIAADEARYHQQKAISLDDEVPFNGRHDHVEESFYEFRDPFDVTTYDELIPAQTPMDVELDPHSPLSDEERAALAEADISPHHRQIVELHDEFELSLSEVAQILEASLHDVAEAVGSARVHVRQWLGSTDVHAVTGDDSVDSYTGEPTDARFTGERGPTADTPTESPLARAARDASTE